MIELNAPRTIMTFSYVSPIHEATDRTSDSCFEICARPSESWQTTHRISTRLIARGRPPSFWLQALRTLTAPSHPKPIVPDLFQPGRAERRNSSEREMVPRNNPASQALSIEQENRSNGGPRQRHRTPDWKSATNASGANEAEKLALNANPGLRMTI
jgi:hypothetical protein